MVGKNNIKKRHELRGEKVETYSIKKFKVGAASVLIGVGIFFGAGTVEASDSVAQSREATNSPDERANTVNIVSENSVKPAANKIVNTHEKVAEAVVGKLATQSGENNRLYTKSGAWKNSSPGFQFLYTKRQISNIIKVYKNN